MAESTATRHAFVFAKAVERLTEAGNMQSITNFNDFTVEGESSSAFTSYVERGVVAKFYSSASLFVVGIECCIVR